MASRKFWKANSFQTKVTLAFILSLLFVIGLANILMYEYSLHSKLDDLRDKLLAIANTAVLAIDPDLLLRVPLSREGINSEEYKTISGILNKVKAANPSIKYIYTMAKTDQPGIWQFMVDPNPVINLKGPTAFPGDKYDASRFPEMLNAYNIPAVDKKMTVDEWGATLSGYAPILSKEGKAIAILGLDINAERIYYIEKMIRLRALGLLGIGILLAFFLGTLISRRVTGPVEKLVEGTRKIASGDLGYKVEIKGRDEIGELAASFNNMASNLAESRRKLNEYFYRVVQAMVRSLEAKDAYTRGHSDRVSEYAVKIARAMGFSPEKVESLQEAAELHDIGKLGIHEDILNKKGQLLDNEWDLMHKHPVVGEEILKPVFLDDQMLAVVRSHHERYDGKGYPDGLKGDEINIFAQIVAVADSYDAMTSSRAYRLALSKEEAVKRLKEGSGTQFNPKVLEAFFNVLG